MQVLAKVRYYFLLLMSCTLVAVVSGLVGHFAFVGAQPDSLDFYFVFCIFAVLGLLGYLSGYLVVKKFFNDV